MCGHAAANIMPVIASNRIGLEAANMSDMASDMTNNIDVPREMELMFYGSSFISDELGNKVRVASRDEQCVLVHTFDLSSIQSHRESWGVYRDRRHCLLWMERSTNLRVLKVWCDSHVQ